MMIFIPNEISAAPRNRRNRPSYREITVIGGEAP